MNRVSPRPWHKRWHGNALNGYRTLTLEERGAYTTLLDAMYDQGGPVRDTKYNLANLLGADPRVVARVRQRLIDAGKIVAVEDASGDRWLVNDKAQETLGLPTSAELTADVRRTLPIATADVPDSDAEKSNRNKETAPANDTETAIQKKRIDEEPFGASETPDREAWIAAVSLLTTVGRMKEPAARAFFGKLLKDNKLDAHQLWPSIIQARLKTEDPRPYLTAAAKGIARRHGGQGGNGPAAVNVDNWTPDIWAAACRAFRERGAWDVAVMGPEPGQPGCKAPPAVVLEAAA